MPWIPRKVRLEEVVLPFVLVVLGEGLIQPNSAAAKRQMEEGLVGRISIALRECKIEEGFLRTRDGKENVFECDLGGVGLNKMNQRKACRFGVQVGWASRCLRRVNLKPTKHMQLQCEDGNLAQG